MQADFTKMPEAITQKTCGQIELKFAQLNSTPKTTPYTQFKQKVRDEGWHRFVDLSWNAPDHDPV